MTYRLETAGRTHPGLVRETNQDQFLIATLTKEVHVLAASPDVEDAEMETVPPEDELLVVADGVGGSTCGEIASREAVRGLIEYVQNRMHWHLHDQEHHEQELLVEFQRALDYCQNRLLADSRKHPERRGMGTTLTTAYVVWPKVFVLHAGDSRCYHIRGNRLSQVTTDHTVAQQMIDAGGITSEELKGSPLNHRIWNAVGGLERSLIPELRVLQLDVGDVLLLCTDGLTNHVTEEDLAKTVQDARRADEACQKLIQKACDGGGSDNITVVIAKFHDVMQPEKITAEAAAIPVLADAIDESTVVMDPVEVELAV